MRQCGTQALTRVCVCARQTRCVRCTPDGRGYAVASVEGRVAVDFFDDAESAASKYAFKCHRRVEGGKDVVYPVNALGACLTRCTPLRRRLLTRIDASPSPHCRAAFHPLHGTFATGGCDGYVNIWDGAAKKRLFVLPKYPSSVAALSFNHDGSLLVRQRAHLRACMPWLLRLSLAAHRFAQAVASSYTFEEGERDHPLDAIFVRPISEAEAKPKPRAPA